MIKTNENCITFGGTLGNDLDIKQGQNKPFGVTSVAQTTYWPKQGEQGFNERTTWMNIKLNGNMLSKVETNGGLFKGDEIVVKGYLTQRKLNSGSTITEIQVESIISHFPKALKDLAKQSGLNQQPQQQQPQQQANGYQANGYQPAYQQHQQAPQPHQQQAPRAQAPAYAPAQQAPAPQQSYAPQPQQHRQAPPQPQGYGQDFYEGQPK